MTLTRSDDRLIIKMAVDELLTNCSECLSGINCFSAFIIT